MPHVVENAAMGSAFILVYCAACCRAGRASLRGPGSWFPSNWRQDRRGCRSTLPLPISSGALGGAGTQGRPVLHIHTDDGTLLATHYLSTT